ncbi:hypothetical protein [Streptomyces sp. ME109]|uniref:hypothetical protein n=1 Tax=Streptomyces sp. me109 TaxID=1827853 RepID=UPI0016512218|nr:hypothetical protein [Streptomyces sp. me109]
MSRALDHHPHLVFGLVGVIFADCTFLTVLLQARLTALEQGGALACWHRAPTSTMS